LRLWPAWLGVNAALLVIYMAVDGAMALRETHKAMREDRRRVEPLRLHGKGNLLLLAGVIAAVVWLPEFWREAATLALAVLSFRLTPKAVREKNRFAWGPIV